MAESGDKQHKPTARRIERARSEGNVARTRELGPALAFLAVAAAALLAGPSPWTYPFLWLERALPDAARATFDAASLVQVAGPGALAWLPAALLLLGSAALGSLLALVLQGGPQPAAAALKIDPSRLSPAGRLRSLVSLSHLWDVVRGLLAGAATAWIVLATARPLLPDLGALALGNPYGVASRIGSILLAVAAKVGLGLALLGILDLLVSRLLHTRSLRMSRQDLKEEMQEQEGRPEVKMRRRRKMLELVRSRSVGQVRRADVVVANPTHYAVALAYRKVAMSAPRVVAKGRNRMAQKIRLEAVKHGVPVVENPPLARQLYRKVEVNREVPPELYLAVAEVIAFVLRLREALPGGIAAEPDARQTS